MKFQWGWGGKIILQLAVVIVPLSALLLLQAVMDLRRAEQLQSAFPTHLQASEARARFKLFVDGLADALDTGKIAAPAVEALKTSRGVVQAVARADPSSEVTEIDRSLGTLVQAATAAQPLEALLPHRDLIGSTNKALEHLDENYQARMQTAITLAGTDARRQVIGALVAALLIVALAAGFARNMIRTLTRPLNDAINRARAIAKGDLSQTSAVAGNDETSQLLGALSAMTRDLRDIVTKVRESSNGINQASDEVAAGSQDLSDRTDAAAANIQQTASSVERLLGAINQNAAHAQQASRLASSASQVADLGGQVVSSVVSTMQDITDRSRKIGDIVGVIDGIAFQTNILALNAAVEAARAGEQGRGFAVVASEVRALAKRSADAAKEIKVLISASLERVDSGAQQASQAGSTMQDIVAQVRQVSHLIEDIHQASSAQSKEVAQLNQVVGALEQMTLQNAALVEKSKTSAQQLKAQGQNLGEAVSVFGA